MNGLDLLSKVNEIHATELKIKEIAGNKVEYKRSGAYTLDELLMLNMDYFKYLTLEDGEWVLVFDYTEPYMVEEPVVEEKPKKTKSKNPVNKPKIKDEKPNKTEVLSQEVVKIDMTDEDVEKFKAAIKNAKVEVLPQKYMNPPEPNQEEIENVMDLFA